MINICVQSQFVTCMQDTPSAAPETEQKLSPEALFTFFKHVTLVGFLRD